MRSCRHGWAERWCSRSCGDRAAARWRGGPGCRARAQAPPVRHRGPRPARGRSHDAGVHGPGQPGAAAAGGAGRPAARARARVRARGRGAGGRQRAGAAEPPGAPAGEPGLAGQAADHLHRAGPAGPGLGLEHAGGLRRSGARRRAGRRPLHQGQWRPAARARAPVAGLAPRPAGGRARGARRHRARPQRLRAVGDRRGGFRWRALAAAQRAGRCAAVEPARRGLDLPARPRARGGAGGGGHRRPGHARAHRGAGRRSLRRLARRSAPAARSARRGWLALRGQLPRQLRRTGLAAGRSRPGRPWCPAGRAGLARARRAAAGGGCATGVCRPV